MPYTKKVTNYYQPASGGTVAIPSFDGDVLAVFIDPATILPILNIQFPDSPADGQIIRIFSSKVLTLVNMTAPTTGGILGAITSMLLNGSAAYAYCASTNTWWKA